MYSLIQNYKYYKQTGLNPSNEVVFQIQQAFQSLDRVYIQNYQSGANANTTEKIAGYNLLNGLHNTYKQPILPGDIKVIIDNENDINAVPVYYNLQGIRIANPKAGEIYIMKKGNKVTKILMTE